jgi:hypothetical protein
MYDVEAMVTETSPTILKLTADWPVVWLRQTGTRTMETQRELLPGEILEPVRDIVTTVEVEAASVCSTFSTKTCPASIRQRNRN